MPVANTLSGKRAVVFDLVMADKVLPKKASGTDGGALLSGVGNAADLNNFNNAASSASWLEQERAALNRKQPALYEAFASRYTQLNNAAVVRTAFNFNGVVPSLTYFSTSDSGIRARIAQVCADNKADFAVTMVGQLVHDETMRSSPISSPAVMVVEVCLFDKNGSLVAQGKTQTEKGTINPSSSITIYRLLLDDVSENIVLMIPALGGNGEKNGTKQFTPPVVKVDSGDTREAGPGETVLVVKRIDSASGWNTNLIINRNSENERSIPLAAKKEIRVVIPNGNHQLEAEVPGGTKEKNDPITITASGTPLTYTLSVKGTVGQGNLKDNERFTWTKQ